MARARLVIAAVPLPLDAATQAGLVGALAGAVAGGLLGLVGVLVSIRHSRRLDRLNVRRRAHVEFLAESQSCDRITRRLMDFSDLADETRQQLQGLRIRLLVEPNPSYGDLMEAQDVEHILATADEAGVTKDEMHGSFTACKPASSQCCP
jgi:hypothetical protein